MKLNSALKKIATASIFTWTGATFAHEGHGLQGQHWHATDTLGFVVVAVLAAAAIWMSRGGK